MNPNDEEMLNEEGWQIECYSPLEIRHTESGSFATNFAAQAVIDSIKVDALAAPIPIGELSPTQVIVALHASVDRVVRLLAQAEAINTASGWEIAFTLVFSDSCCHKVSALLKQLNLSFEYYDPDEDYEDDVRAYTRALFSRMEELSPFLDAYAAG